MAQSCSVCGVYGVLLTADLSSAIVSAIEDSPDFDALHDDLLSRSVRDDGGRLVRPEWMPVKVFDRIKEEIGGAFTPGASLHFTGRDDDRPARGQTDPEMVVYGFGLYVMPPCDSASHRAYVAATASEAFTSRSRLHLWAEVV